MRGKVPKRSAPAGAAGITPACAGKRIWFLDNSILARDHPRVCGEKLSDLPPQKSTLGSPPRVRGKGNFHVVTHTEVGITPACAGKSYHTRHMFVIIRDHPRVCGEKKKGGSPEKSGLGSPPRVRGKDSESGSQAGTNGITPACAGKSLGRLPDETEPGDHPRVCGEKTAVCHDHASEVGSPPRVRGKARNNFDLEFEIGITPACAGKSRTMVTFPSFSRDHPRVCGEKYLQNVARYSGSGSPPRVRGKAPAGVAASVATGITPACAGKRHNI